MSYRPLTDAEIHSYRKLCEAARMAELDAESKRNHARMTAMADARSSAPGPRLSDPQLHAMREAVSHPEAIGAVSPQTVCKLIDELLELRADVATKQRGYADLHALIPGGGDIWSKVDALVKERDNFAQLLRIAEAVRDDARAASQHYLDEKRAAAERCGDQRGRERVQGDDHEDAGIHAMSIQTPMSIQTLSDLQSARREAHYVAAVLEIAEGFVEKACKISGSTIEYRRDGRVFHLVVFDMGTAPVIL